MKRMMSVVASLLAMLMLLAACAAPGDPSDTTAADTTAEPETSAEETTEAPPRDVVLFDGGKTDYTLVYAATASAAVMTALDELKAAVAARLGVELVVGSDGDVESGTDESGETAGPIEEQAKEILIGACEREESKQVRASLEVNTYAIRMVNGKLVIVGVDHYATAQAIRAFIDTYLGEPVSTLVVKDNLNVVEKSALPQEMCDLTEGADMRLMTFNTLGSGTEYEKRRPNEIQMLLDYLPDVVGVQEANKKVHAEVLKADPISDYYAMNVEYHPNTTTVNYTAILYLKSKYTLIDSGIEWLDSRYTETNTKSMSWAVLERIGTGERFAVVNMHGAVWTKSYPIPNGQTYESMRELAHTWRVDNVRQMLERVNAILATYPDIPLITMGDFNFDNDSAAYAAMMAGHMDDTQMTATVRTVENLKSFHTTVGAAPVEGQCIDHIFYTDDSLETLTFALGMRQLDLDASDHCPVYADVKFK